MEASARKSEVLERVWSEVNPMTWMLTLDDEYGSRIEGWREARMEVEYPKDVRT